MKTNYEKNKLYDYLGEDLVEIFKTSNAIIAGGAITSLFCNRDINDIDVYFRNYKDCSMFVEDIYDEGVYIKALTNKAVLFQLKGTSNYQDKLKEVQAIYFKYFDKVEDIFNTYDFTVCMGAFDFKEEKFIFDESFFIHNSQRLLSFNHNTAFPIISLLRVQKYKDKEYKISKNEMIKIILTCMNLKINTHEEFKEQIGGMYGEDYSDVIDTTKPFSLIDIIVDIDKFSEKIKPNTEKNMIEFDDVEDILIKISKGGIEGFEFKGKYYKIKASGEFKKCEKDVIDKFIDIKDVFKDLKFYKNIKQDTYSLESRFVSYYDPYFEYVLGSEIIPKGWNNAICCYETTRGAKSGYYGNDLDRVLIELTIDSIDDIKNITSEKIELHKCRFTNIIYNKGEGISILNKNK